MGNEDLTNKNEKEIHWFRKFNFMLFMIFSAIFSYAWLDMLSFFNKFAFVPNKSKLLCLSFQEIIIIIVMAAGQINMEKYIRNSGQSHE